MNQQQLLPLAHAWVTRRRKAGTIGRLTADNQRRIVADFAISMGNRRPEQIGPADIERWMGTMSHLAIGTRRNNFGVARSFLDDLVDNDRIRRNPARKLDAPKVPRAPHRSLDAEQVAAILNACPDERSLCFTLVGFQTGVRRAEMAGVELGDINRTARTLTVTGKGGHTRTIPLPDEAMAATIRYLNAHPASSGPLIRQDRYPTLGVTPEWLGLQFVEIAYEAGVKKKPRDGISYHACRHTAATDIYLACKDVVVVRDILGHANLSTTQTYVAGMDLSTMRAAMEGRHYAA